MSLVQEWKKLIADEEAKLEKLNEQIINNKDEKEKQIKMIQSIRECYNRFNFFVFIFKPRREKILFPGAEWNRWFDYYLFFWI